MSGPIRHDRTKWRAEQAWKDDLRAKHRAVEAEKADLEKAHKALTDQLQASSSNGSGASGKAVRHKDHKKLPSKERPLDDDEVQIEYLEKQLNEQMIEVSFKEHEILELQQRIEVKDACITDLDEKLARSRNECLTAKNRANALEGDVRMMREEWDADLEIHANKDREFTELKEIQKSWTTVIGQLSTELIVKAADIAEKSARIANLEEVNNNLLTQNSDGIIIMKCPICLDIVNSGATAIMSLRCGHMVCQQCYNRLPVRSPCPCCRNVSRSRACRLYPGS